MDREFQETTLRHQVFGTDRPVVFVTGSSAPRVGRVIAENFLQAGYRVVLHAHHVETSLPSEIESLRSSGDDVDFVSGAIEQEENVQCWVQHILRSRGRIDVVVNSAAVWQPQPLEQLSAAEVEHAFRINTLGPTLVAKHFGLAMVKQISGGVVINIGDWAVVRPYKDFAHYFVSKGAIETLTTTMAVELANRNPRVRVNAVLPGPVLLAEGISVERQQQIIAHSLVKRAGTPMDVARAVLFLAENSFLTGVCLPVDGGRSIYAGPSVDPHAHPEYQP